MTKTIWDTSVCQWGPVTGEGKLGDDVECAFPKVFQCQFLKMNLSQCLPMCDYLS